MRLSGGEGIFGICLFLRIALHHISCCMIVKNWGLSEIFFSLPVPALYIAHVASGDDFWQVAKTDDRRAGVTFDMQPTQVYTVQSTVPTHSKCVCAA